MEGTRAAAAAAERGGAAELARMSERPAAGEPREPAGASAGTDPLGRVLEMVRYLRAHCPWDAAQTPRSLLPYLLEEAHEVADAVEENDDDELRAELGDLLLHVAFQIVLAEERSVFDVGEVADGVIAKMRRRHPHIFGTAGEGAGGSGETGRGEGETGSAQAWEALKARERPGRSLVEGLARGLDPLARAHRLQERVSAVGFDWEDPEGALAKVREEVEEVAQALARVRAAGDAGSAPERVAAPAEGAEAEGALEEELGDLLFAVVNLARLAGTHGMHALSRANRKFGGRFRGLERLAGERGVALGEAPLAELDALWDEVKRAEQGGRAPGEAGDG